MWVQCKIDYIVMMIPFVRPSTSKTVPPSIVSSAMHLASASVVPAYKPGPPCASMCSHHLPFLTPTLAERVVAMFLRTLCPMIRHEG